MAGLDRVGEAVISVATHGFSCAFILFSNQPNTPPFIFFFFFSFFPEKSAALFGA
jgi:hypothetical protein